MNKLAKITIIDDKKTRGIFGPVSELPKDVFEDMIELIRYSQKKDKLNNYKNSIKIKKSYSNAMKNFPPAS